jgi:hypothetical protein
MRTFKFAACLVLLACVAAIEPAQAQTMDELAARGAEVANADPLALELRSRAPDDESRRGFDIGMAAAEGNTAPGPGKQRIHDSLPWGEQGGFDAAVSFSLQRNRNAKAAATGAAIAGADPVVAQARTAEPDVFYWLGFDIASGIFGDPALGAAGNTALGPGSLGIRNALNPAAQRGFNASVALHQSRRPAGPDPNAQVVSAGRTSVRTSAVLLAQALPRVPNLIGLSVNDANGILSGASLSSKYTYLNVVDQSVLYNHVGATIPAAGAVVPGGIVELQIPRPATRDGIGALSLSDVIRRDGFDLDEGRYEQILRGADMLLREDMTPIPTIEPTDGHTYYMFKGLFVEPSDGAVFAADPSYRLMDDVYPGGLGSALNYEFCSGALTQSRAPYINLPRGDYFDHDILFCVLTSSRQIAVVQFQGSDRKCCGANNYKFHIALYPKQTVPALRARKSVATPYRVTQ